MQNTIENKIWTVLSLLQWTSEYLHAKGFDDARLNGELMLAHILNCTRVDLYLHFDKPLSAQELSSFKILFKRRLSHEPLQYVLGATEFMGLKFAVDRRVLIPRAETEVLVEEALKIIRGTGGGCSVLDVGTGSGCIAVSLARHFPACVVTATDSNEESLEVARANASSNGAAGMVRFIHHDIFHPVDDLPGKPYDAILSNPPYISESEKDSLAREILDFEPPVALLEGGDGLRFFRRIVGIGADLLKNGGWLCFEVGYDQAEPVSRMFSVAGYGDLQTIKDYSGNDRVVRARWGSGG